jgi:TPR repeat protein
LIKRARALMIAGDIAAARVVLQRAAEAGDSEAALTLGTTYDPATLTKLNAPAIAADVAMARMWYEKARELGSSEAPQVLDRLAQQSR